MRFFETFKLDEDYVFCRKNFVDGYNCEEEQVVVEYEIPSQIFKLKITFSV